MKTFIAAFIIMFALVTLPVPFPGYVTGPIKLFGILMTAGIVIILMMHKTPHEHLQEQQAEARKRYRQKPDPYWLGHDAARHHADFTLSRKEILARCNRDAQFFSPADAKEFMRGASKYIQTAFGKPIHVEV